MKILLYLSLAILPISILAAPSVKNHVGASTKPKNAVQIQDPLKDSTHMIYLKYHFFGRNASNASVINKPRETWRVSYKYLKTIESYNPDENLREMILISEPDAWIINLIDKQGKHIVDPDKNGMAHDTIVKYDEKKDFLLEFGNEFAFFQKNHAKQLPDDEILGVMSHVYQLEINDSITKLYVDPATNHPLEIQFNYNNSNSNSDHFGIIYETYENDLKPDLALFKLDPDFKTIEQPAK